MTKKLIIFIPSIEEGGVEKNLFIIANYLAQKKLNIEVITCNFNKSKYFFKPAVNKFFNISLLIVWFSNVLSTIFSKNITC